MGLSKGGGLSVPQDTRLGQRRGPLCPVLKSALSPAQLPWGGGWGSGPLSPGALRRAVGKAANVCPGDTSVQAGREVGVAWPSFCGRVFPVFAPIRRHGPWGLSHSPSPAPPPCPGRTSWALGRREGWVSAASVAAPSSRRGSLTSLPGGHRHLQRGPGPAWRGVGRRRCSPGRSCFITASHAGSRGVVRPLPAHLFLAATRAGLSFLGCSFPV